MDFGWVMGLLLFCLAIAMIVGGSAAVYSGSLIISIERGWSMMIAGSVCASAGAIVLGLAVLAGRLRRISRQTEALDETMSRIEMTTWGPPPPLPSEEIEQLRPPPIEPEPVAQAACRPDLDVSHVASEPEPDIVPPNATVAETLSSATSVAEPGEPALPREPVLAPDPVAGEPTVVGSYSAGENAYLMYSDGSIQADTPEGRYRFGSLDELKTYVAEGERKAQASSSNEAARPTEAASSIDPQPQIVPETAEIAKA